MEDITRFEQHRPIIESIEITQYKSPNLVNYKEHHEQTKQFGKDLQEGMQVTLELLLDDIKHERFLINSVGSDARLEKGPVSPVEIAVYTDNRTYKRWKTPEWEPEREEIDETLANRLVLYGNEFTSAKFTKHDIEMRNIDAIEPAKFTVTTNEGNTATLKSPNRIFDAQPLYGDQSLRNKQLQLFQEEARSPRGGRRLDDIKSRLNDHLETTKTGYQLYKQRGLQHFVPQTGVVTYDNTELWSVKQGPLRAVQYALVRDKYRMNRDGVPIEEIDNVARNTVDQIDDLNTRFHTNLTDETVSELQDHYKYFTWLYHKSQWHHRHHDEKQITTDPHILQERTQDLAKILNDQTYMFRDHDFS